MSRVRRWRARRILIGVATVVFVTVEPGSGAAQTPASPSNAQQEAAVAAAQNFVARFDEGDFGEIYEEEMSPTFRSLMARDNFLQQGGFIRVQSGGRAVARELVGTQSFAQTPTGARGEYYYVRFRTRYPNGLVFQDVYMEKVGPAWKVMGFYLNQAPQQ